MDSVAAIVKGAVTAGISERVVTSRVARRHYLMATLQPFKEGHHPEQYRVPSLDGKDRCKYTRQIFVQKGERIKNGEPVKVSFFRQVAPGATLMYEDILYGCDEDVCPEYTKDPRKSNSSIPISIHISASYLPFHRYQGSGHSNLRPFSKEPGERLRTHGYSTRNLLPRILRHLPHPRRKRIQRRTRLPGRSHG